MPQVYPVAAKPHLAVMRTLDQNHGGGVGSFPDRKPSKLEQMRENYQKKLMREKEEKMVHLYEESKRKGMMTLARNGSGGAGEPLPTNGARSPNGGKSVREFFNERRRLEAAGGPMPNIDHHYKQAKGYSSPGGWSSRTGSGKSVTMGKSSAGRDRAQPLAPIQRRPAQATETMAPPSGALGRSGIPLRQQQQQQHPAGPGGNGMEDNPFQGRPRLIKHKPLPPTSNGHGGSSDQNAAEGRLAGHQPSSLPRYVPNNNNRRQPAPPSSQQQYQHHPQQQHQFNHHQQQQQQQPQQHMQNSRLPQPPPGSKPAASSRMNGKARTVATKTSPAVTNGHHGGRGNDNNKLTDFQKWQMEQNKARDDRLKQFNATKPVAASNDGYWGQSDEDDDNDDANGNDGTELASHRSSQRGGDNQASGRSPPLRSNINLRPANKDRLNRLNGQRHAMPEDNGDDEDEEEEDEGEEDIPEEDEEEDDDDEGEDAIKAQERALMEAIAAKQKEVAMIRKEREKEEEEEKREAALRKKREAAEKARQKKLEEERRKEEERQRKLDEEEEKQERKREEQRQREEEKRRKDDEKRRREDDRRRQEEDRKAAKRLAEEEKRQAKQQTQWQQEEEYDGHEDHSPIPASSRSRPSQRHQSPPDTSRSHDIDEKPVAGADAEFYRKMAASSDAKGSTGSLVACRQCGRKFASDRIKKHQDACKKANKPRKEFNAALKRVEGTEMAKYAGKNRRPEPQKKKSNWRAKHEEFIQSLRYAKQVTAYEKGGGDLKDLAPPPPSNNPDLVPCPHCGRTFNETAAERHIPRCQNLKTRPPPLNTRRR